MSMRLGIFELLIIAAPLILLVWLFSMRKGNKVSTRVGSIVVGENGEKPLGLVLVTVYWLANGVLSLLGGYQLGAVVGAASAFASSDLVQFASILSLIFFGVGILSICAAYGVWSLQTWGHTLSVWLCWLSILSNLAYLAFDRTPATIITVVVSVVLAVMVVRYVSRLPFRTAKSVRSQARPSTSAAQTATDKAFASNDDVSAWDRIMDKENGEALQEYLLRHPEGRFAELAKIKLERLGVAPLGSAATMPHPASANSPSSGDDLFANLRPRKYDTKKRM
jgi:hypothetical protein